MLEENTVVFKKGWLALGVLAVAACGPSEEMLQQRAQLDLVTAQKDSLVLAVAEHGRMLRDISSELASLQLDGSDMVVTASSPLEASRDTIIQKFRYLTTRVSQTQAQLRQTQARVRNLSSANDSLRTSLEAAIADIAVCQREIESHRGTIASLTEQVTGLQAERTQLTAQLEAATVEANRVYYLIGTREDLLRRGIVEELGGARVLFLLWKKGETLVPARGLKMSDFTAIDRRRITEIALPAAESGYRIVSRQDVASLATPPDENGMIRGPIRITAPDRFWASSRFLIVVTK